MRNLQKKLSTWILVGLFLGAFFGITQVKDTNADNQQNIIYIFFNDAGTANSYKTFLETNGHFVSLIHMDVVNIVTYSNYDLVIIGHDTSDIGTDRWTGNTSAIVSSGTPVLSFHEGGIYFIDALGGPEWDENAILPQIANVTVVETTHHIFNTPHTIPTNAILTTVLVDNLMLVSTFADAYTDLLASFFLISTNFLIYNWDNGITNVIQFGSEASIEDMTQTGKNLILNIVDYLTTPETNGGIPSFQWMFVVTAISILIVLLRIRVKSVSSLLKNF